MSKLSSIVILGFSVIFIPLIVVGIASNLGGSEWTTVGQYVAFPCVIIFVIGLLIMLMSD